MKEETKDKTLQTLKYIAFLVVGAVVALNFALAFNWYNKTVTSLHERASVDIANGLIANANANGGNASFTVLAPDGVNDTFNCTVAPRPIAETAE